MHSVSFACNDWSGDNVRSRCGISSSGASGLFGWMHERDLRLFSCRHVQGGSWES
jgi:hypothetical protein